MQRIISLGALLLSGLCIAQDLPQPSPRGEVEQVVGLTKVKVNYGRPSANGRSIFGGLVPHGEVWRTGANECTTIAFDGPVRFGEQQVAAGRYALFTIPTPTGFTFILNSDASLWGAYGHDASKDVARANATIGKCESTEVLTFSFGAFKPDAARLDLSWADTRASLWITAPSDEQAKANIKEALAKPDADAGTFSSCAEFYLERGLDKSQALEWAKTSVAKKKMFWNNFTLAQAYQANGMMKEAISTAEESVALANAAGEKGPAEAYAKQLAAWKSAK